MRAALTDKQSDDVAVMSGPDFSSLFFPFFLPSRTSQSVVTPFSLQPWALLTQKSVTPHTGDVSAAITIHEVA